MKFRSAIFTSNSITFIKRYNTAANISVLNYAKTFCHFPYLRLRNLIATSFYLSSLRQADFFFYSAREVSSLPYPDNMKRKCGKAANIDEIGSMPVKYILWRKWCRRISRWKDTWLRSTLTDPSSLRPRLAGQAEIEFFHVLEIILLRRLYWDCGRKFWKFWYFLITKNSIDA